MLLKLSSLPVMLKCGLRMRWECQERFPRHARTVMHARIANERFPFDSMALPARSHAPPTIIRIW